MLGSDFLECKNRIRICREQLAVEVHDHLVVLQRYDELTEILMQAWVAGEGIIETDLERILEGLLCAARNHKGQTRKNSSKTPYTISQK